MGLCRLRQAFPKVEAQMVAANPKGTHVQQFCSNRSFWHHPSLSPIASATHHTQHCNHMGNLMFGVLEPGQVLVLGQELAQVQGLVRGLELALELVLVLELVLGPALVRALGLALALGLAWVEELAGVLVLVGILCCSGYNNTPSCWLTTPFEHYSNQHYNHTVLVWSSPSPCRTATRGAGE